jgi:uncharacterized membrane protein
LVDVDAVGYGHRVRQKIEAWNGRSVVVSGFAAWALLVSALACGGWALAQLIGLVTVVPDWLRLGLLLLALPSLLMIIAVPIFGRRA